MTCPTCKTELIPIVFDDKSQTTSTPIRWLCRCSEDRHTSVYTNSRVRCSVTWGLVA